MKVLVTGFDPFGGESINPAFEAVKMLPDEIAGAKVVKVEIPTVFRKCADKVRQEILKEKPDLVISIGQAGGRAGISIEKVAINLEDGRIPDNEGNQPIEVSIKEDGAAAYFATIPVKAMAANVEEHGIPAHVSYTAGTYVCNDVMYHLLYMLDKEFPGVRGGFIHVPFDTKQVKGKPITTPSMPIATISEGLKFAIEAAINNLSDIQKVGGTTH
jgi:pyroglutamyl-peptidase